MSNPLFFRLLLLFVLGAAAGAVQGQDAEGVGLLTLEVTIDEERLFHPTTGWFVEGPNTDRTDWKKAGANYWTHDSHPAFVKIVLPNRRVIFSGEVDFRLFGGLSRMHPQKSFSLSCREKYGKPAIEYPLFGSERPAKFKYLVARNAGSDWGRSYMRDALLSGLLKDPSWELDLQAARPCRVTINGGYWGLYYLREKINPHWLAERFGVEDKSTIDLLEGTSGVKHGSRQDYDRLMKLARRSDLSREDAFLEVRQRMDVDNYQRLQIAQIYFDNQEAGGNLRYWRDRADPSSRYRWILYDVDQGFGLHDEAAYRRNTLELLTAADGPAWPNPPWVTRLQRNLLANEGYRNTFVNRTLDYLQTDFHPNRVVAAIDRHAAAIAAEIPAQSERWNIQRKYWPIHVERLRAFARERPAHVREHFRQKFAGGPDRKVSLEVGEGGSVMLNDNITVAKAQYHGRYFANFPITVEAIARPGYRFTGWSDGTAEPKRRVDLRRPGPYRLHPNFAPASAPISAATYVRAAAQEVEGLSEVLLEKRGKPGLTRAEITARLSVALVVFVLVALYGSVKRKPE